MMKPIKKTRKITWQTMLSLTCLTAWMFSSPLVAQTNRLSIGEVTGVQGGILSLPVFLDNESEVAGGQFRLTLPDGMEVKGVEMETSRADKHTVEYYRSEKTHELSVVFYASPTAILKGNHGKICNVLLSIPINYATGDYPIGFGSGMKLASDAMTEAPVTEVISGIIHVESKPVVYYTIDITSTIGGHAEGGGTYAEGQDVVLTATAEDGYEFVKWSDGTYDNPYRLTVSRDMILQAEFSPKSYTLTYMLDGEIYHTEDVPYGSTCTIGSS